MDTIIENNNKKLAIFMNNAIVDSNNNHKDTYNYHNDWNWLMLVVEKIEQTETKDGRTFTIDLHRDNVIINQYGKYNNEIVVTGRGTRIENLYNACVEFVEWYNKEQSDNAINNSIGFIGKKIFGGAIGRLK